jgi:Flp pilus assembly protein TadG
MIAALNRRFQAFRRDERGTGLVELAMVTPMLALLTVGIVDLSEGFTRRAQLHDAVHRTLEKVAARRFRLTITGTTVDTAFMVADAAAAAGVQESDVTVTAWLECDGVQQPTFTSDCPALANPPPACSDPTPPADTKCAAIQARYIRIRVDASYRPTFGKVVTPATGGTVPLFAEGAVRVQ